MNSMINNPKISIIMPIYNAGEYLKPCIDSIMSQDIQDWECILIDDNSTDDSLLYCKNIQEKDNRFIVVSNNSNKGPGGCRNQGLKLAKAKYVSFVDSDDILSPFYLSSMYETAESCECMAVVCWCEHIDEKCMSLPNLYKLITKKEILDSFEQVSYGENEYFENYGHVPWRRLINRDFLIKHELYFCHAKRGEDASWCFLSSMIMGRYFVTKVPLYLYRKGHNSLMTKNNSRQYLYNQAYINYKYKKDYILKHLDDFVDSQYCIDNQMMWVHVLLRENVKARFDQKTELANFKEITTIEYPVKMVNIFISKRLINRVFSMIYNRSGFLSFRLWFLKMLVLLGI